MTDKLSGAASPAHAGGTTEAASIKAEPKHTPGPWTFAYYAMSPENIAAARKLGMEPMRLLTDEGQASITTQNGTSHICFVTRQAAAKRPAEMRSPSQGYKTECPERDANAYLIAAAPDLLTALKQAVECVEYCRRAHKGAQSGDGVPIEMFWKALIARAEGRS